MLFPLLVGGVCLLGSVLGTYLVKLGPSRNIMAALYKGFLGAAVVSAVVLLPITLLFLGGNTVYQGGGASFTGWGVYGCTLVGLLVTGCLMWITDYYTGTNHRPVQKIAAGLDHRPRHQHHPGPRGVDGGDRAAGRGDLRRHPARLPVGRPVRHRASRRPPCWR